MKILTDLKKTVPRNQCISPSDTFCKAFPFHIIFDRILWSLNVATPSIESFPGKGHYILWELRWKATEMLLLYVATDSLNLCLSVREHGALVYHRSTVTVNSVCLRILQLCLGQLLFFSFNHKSSGRICQKQWSCFHEKTTFQ